jgi:hypothetical protein
LLQFPKHTTPRTEANPQQGKGPTENPKQREPNGPQQSEGSSKKETRGGNLLMKMAHQYNILRLARQKMFES